jgi:hypothetical protein
MRNRLTAAACCVVLIAVAAAVRARRHVSSQSVSDIQMEKVVQQFIGSSAKPMMVDNTTETIRPDGTRLIAILRTFQPSASSTQWESGERQIFYDAAKGITYDISPALQMYASVPLGKLQYRPLTPMADCAGLLQPGDKVLQQSTGAKFGMAVQTYTVRRGDNQTVETVTTDFYPTLGCLVGDETGQLRDQATGAVKAARTQRVVAMTPVADSPALFAEPPATFTQAKPSEILRKYLQTTGQSCPQCMLNMGAQADARSERLWARRAQGTSAK